jgi:hypothetical protein
MKKYGGLEVTNVECWMLVLDRGDRYSFFKFSRYLEIKYISVFAWYSIINRRCPNE